jgi:hypothetical protein
MITNYALSLTLIGVTLVGTVAPSLQAANLYVDQGQGRRGNDNNAGTSIAWPFRTIGKAALVATAGDTVWVRTGVYRETVVPRNNGRAGRPIVFQPYRGEAVTLSGTQRVTGWELVGNNVYRARMPWDFTSDFQSNQIFVNERMVHLTRWPSNRGTLTRPTDAKVVRAADAGDGKITFTVDESFNEPNGRWNGAQVWVNLSLNQDGQGTNRHCRFNRQRSQYNHRCGIDNRTFNDGKNNSDQAWGVGPGTELFIFNPTLAGMVATGGVEQTLDSGEWWYDEANRQLYLKTSTAAHPRFTTWKPSAAPMPLISAANLTSRCAVSPAGRQHHNRYRRCGPHQQRGTGASHRARPLERALSHALHRPERQLPDAVAAKVGHHSQRLAQHVATQPSALQRRAGRFGHRAQQPSTRKHHSRLQLHLNRSRYARYGPHLCAIAADDQPRSRDRLQHAFRQPAAGHEHSRADQFRSRTNAAWRACITT